MARSAKQDKIDTRLLVDEFAKIKREKIAIEKRYKDLRDQIIGLGQTTCLGTNCAAVLLERTRTSIDTAVLKAQFGIKWYEDRCKTSVYYEVEVVDHA